MCLLSYFHHIWLFATLGTVAHQDPLSVGFSRQYWSGWCPPRGDLPDPGTELTSLMSSALAGEFFTTSATWEAHQNLSVQSVQFSHSVVSDSLRPHESQHARPPCPSPTPRVHSNSHPSSPWCHPAISSSVVPFSSCPQSLQASVFKTSHMFLLVVTFLPVNWILYSALLIVFFLKLVCIVLQKLL